VRKTYLLFYVLLKDQIIVNVLSKNVFFTAETTLGHRHYIRYIKRREYSDPNRFTSNF